MHTLHRKVTHHLSFLCRIDQCLSDTIRRSSRITMLQTLKTMRRCNTPQFFYFFHKWIQDCTSRHSHRTFYDHDVFFSCIQVGFFIADICIAFFCCNESCRRLYGICSEGKCTRCAFTVMNSPPIATGIFFPYFSENV